MIFTFWTSEKNEEAAFIPPSIGAWREQYPNLVLFSSSEATQVLDEFWPEYVDLFRRIRIPACQSDLARLLLLYRYGGLYIDSHAGPGEPLGLVDIFEKLASFELIVFEKPWERKDPNDRHIINTIMCGRRSSPIVRKLIESALSNLNQHEQKEHDAATYVPYNIYVLTGAWDILLNLFDRNNGVLQLKTLYNEGVYLFPLEQGGRSGVQLYKYYEYRKAGQHWSERQNNEVLFRRRPNDVLLIDKAPS